MAKAYKPIIVGLRMSDMGYWVVTVSMSPWQRVSVMVCSVGVTRTEAESAALLTIAGISAREDNP